MSADNGYVLRKNSKGQFVLQMFFMSDEKYPDIDRENAEKFDTLEEALDKYEAGEDSFEGYWSEYGLDLEINHITYSKKEALSMLETQKFTRRPFPVEAVRVTSENARAVAEWCGGETKTDTDGRIMVDPKINKPQSVRLAYARIGDWVVYAGSQYKVYTPRAFEKSFDPLNVTVSQPTPETDRPALEVGIDTVSVITPDGPVQVIPHVEQPRSAQPSPAFLASLAKRTNGQRS